MADLALDTTGDLLIEAADIGLVYDDDAIRQTLKTRLQDVLGEYFRDTTQGTDWFGAILGKQSDATRRAEFRRVIIGTDGISGLAKLELDYSGTRELAVSFVAIKDDGTPLDVRFDNLTPGGA